MSTQNPHAPFYATLFAICYLATVAAALSAVGKYTEAIGLGAAVTGLLALARMPSATTQPTATTTSGDIIQKDPTP